MAEFTRLAYNAATGGWIDKLAFAMEHPAAANAAVVTSATLTTAWKARKQIVEGIFVADEARKVVNRKRMRDEGPEQRVAKKSRVEVEAQLGKKAGSTYYYNFMANNYVRRGRRAGMRRVSRGRYRNRGFVSRPMRRSRSRYRRRRRY